VSPWKHLNLNGELHAPILPQFKPYTRSAEYKFYTLSRQIGLRGPSASHGPRLHDFRHRFAVQTLVQWYRAGAEVGPRLPILSTYLGHVQVRDTYWYLTACPELMGCAVQRLEQRWEGRS
jgi:integrase/recombinase XerD